MSRTSLFTFSTFAALILLWLAYGQLSQPPAPAFRATVIAEPSFARAWSPAAGVVDHHGKPRMLSDFKGKVVLLFFGYTQCPDVCPTALHRATQVMKQLGEQEADRVQVLFMTLDPKRDTVELLNEYVPAFDPRFLGLRPAPEAVDALAGAFKVFYRINPGSTPETYTLDHGVTTYAYDPGGQLRLAISHGASVEDVTADIKALLTQ